MPDPGLGQLSLEDIRDAWSLLAPEERVEAFSCLTRADAQEFYEELTPRAQATIVMGCPPGERRIWLRLLPPDDLADVLQELEPEEREGLLALVDERLKREARALLAYAEDEAGGLMSPRFARVRPDMTVTEAILYTRRQAEQRLEMVYYVYVLDSDQKLLGVVTFRQLLTAPGDRIVRDLMETDILTVSEHMDQEAVARVIAREDILAVPVVDDVGRMKGIVTVDDVVDVVQEEATEDIHRLGGLEALDLPYMQTRFFAMFRKRAVWLSLLFLGEMLTATAMSAFEGEIASLIALSLFIPLIISSGGNSGSQATTLVIRAMALGEVKLRDWFRVIRRELVMGAVLGAVLAAIGICRIVVWQKLSTFSDPHGMYGAHYMLIALTVAFSLIGVVTWGTMAGTLLPFVLRRVGLDPASASAPLVATIVDVSGLIIYFNVARLILL